MQRSRACALFNQCSCHPRLCRRGLKEAEESLSDEPHESSEEDMEWSGNSSLFANLSIPQLDGAADESSGESLPLRFISRAMLIHG